MKPIAAAATAQRGARKLSSPPKSAKPSKPRPNAATAPPMIRSRRTLGFMPGTYTSVRAFAHHLVAWDRKRRQPSCPDSIGAEASPLAQAHRKRHVAGVHVLRRDLVPVVLAEPAHLDEGGERLAVRAQRLERHALFRWQFRCELHLADGRALLGLLVEAERSGAALQ